MRQITEICERGVHDVELVNRIGEYIDPRNIISPPMIRRRECYHSFKDIVSTTGACKNFPEHQQRTQISNRILPAVWPD